MWSLARRLRPRKVAPDRLPAPPARQATALGTWQ
jgi:hypothetical protein